MEGTASWEGNSCSASQHIPCILWKWKVHCCVQNSLPLVTVKNQISPGHTLPSCVCEIHFKTIQLMPSSGLFLLLPAPHHQNTACISVFSRLCHKQHSSHSLWFAHSNNVWWGVRIFYTVSWCQSGCSGEFEQGLWLELVKFSSECLKKGIWVFTFGWIVGSPAVMIMTECCGVCTSE